MHSAYYRDNPEYPSRRSQQTQLPPPPLQPPPPPSSTQPSASSQQTHIHTHAHAHAHSSSGHRAGVGQPARPQVSPLPHLHVLMAQSQREAAPPGTPPASAHSYQFTSPAGSSGPKHAGRVGSYSSRLAPTAYTTAGSTNLYPSTLLPSHHIQAQQQQQQQHQQHTRQPHQQLQKPPQHHHNQQQQQQQQQQQHNRSLHAHLANGTPVKLLQSCDSCRRRKIRCSGEKPTCSACIRYQEICHYSPLATPRRRVGKRARLAIESAAAAPADAGTDGPRDFSAKDTEPSSRPSPAAVPAAPTRDSAANTPPAGNDDSEVGVLRQELRSLTRKFDALNDKMDMLLNAMDRKHSSRHRRHSLHHQANSSERAFTSDIDVDMHSIGSNTDTDIDAESVSDDGLDGAGMDPGNEDGHDDGHRKESGHEFSNLVDKTSRFGIDATNIGVIADMINSMNKQGGPSVESVRVLSTNDLNAGARGLGHPTMSRFISTLEAAEMQQHLLDTFFLHADVGTISFIPRQIFQRLQRESRTPTSMVNVMLAEACNYSSAPELAAVGRATARGYFIERAYRALFECLEYDSAEHCVAILLFSMIISKAGLHRAWIMHSLSMQMAIRLRFNTLDSPLSAPAFKNDTALTREWKRRVFWQLYTYDILTSTLSDLPPCLAIRDIRCNNPTPMTSTSDDMAVLGPAMVFCDDQETIDLQVELLGIMYDISTLQNRLSPEESLFPPDFAETHERIAAWRKRMPHMDTLVSGSLDDIADTFAKQPRLIFLGLLCQYAQIFLCLIKDTWLPSTRKMTSEEESTLAWARQTAYDASQVVHRLVPLVREMRLNIVCPFVSCVVFQACIVSLHSCSWWPSKDDPRRALASVNSVQQGLDFLEYVVPRWGFAGVLTTSLRSLIVERGFGMQESGGANANSGAAQPQEPKEPHESDPSKLADAESPSSPSADPPLSAERMRPFSEESQWERILRTGEMPYMLRSSESSAAASNGISNRQSPANESPNISACGNCLDAAHAFGESSGSSRPSFDTPILDFVHRRLLGAEQCLQGIVSKEQQQQPSKKP
ncbi:hypothetical protein GGF40_003607 [Coemansia sp. RSA 1286]|nr:hypothetical protein GGF40_003607 [Coemansia sp. RSA 1286]